MFPLLLTLMVVVQPGLQCSVDNLPPFRDFRDDDETPSETHGRDRFQAIVPAYTFQCSGRVTEWGACVQPGGCSSCQYYIRFQVWRPTDISGCYSLVDFNRPVDEDGNDGVLSPPGDRNDPLHRCVVLSVPEDQQIEVQSGDVVGYYVDYFRDGEDKDDGSIQWIVDDPNMVVVHYRDNLPRQDIKSHYAVGGVNPTSCGFPTSGDDINSLSSSIQAAPIINLTVIAVPMPTTSVSSSKSITTFTLPDGDTVSSTTSTSDTTFTTGVPPSPPTVTTDRGGSSDSRIVGAVAGVVPLLLVVIVTCVVILLCVRHRRRKTPQPTENATYNIHNDEIKTGANKAYGTVDSDVVATTNPACTNNSGSGISTSNNSAYATTRAPTTGCQSEDIIDTSTNVAYLPTTISTSDNPAYGPVEDNRGNTLTYDYVAARQGSSK